MASRAQGFRVLRGWGFRVWDNFYDFVLHGWVVSVLTSSGLRLEEAEQEDGLCRKSLGVSGCEQFLSNNRKEQG